MTQAPRNTVHHSWPSTVSEAQYIAANDVNVKLREALGKIDKNGPDEAPNFSFKNSSGNNPAIAAIKADYYHEGRRQASFEAAQIARAALGKQTPEDKLT